MLLVDENEMQVLVHPDDWQMLAFESPSGTAATETPDLFGVPVLYDEEAAESTGHPLSISPRSAH